MMFVDLLIALQRLFFDFLREDGRLFGELGSCEDCQGLSKLDHERCSSIRVYLPSHTSVSRWSRRMEKEWDERLSVQAIIPSKRLR
jgi:hypothetical protein